MFSLFSLSLAIGIGKIVKIEKSIQGDHAFIFDAFLEYVNIFRLERFPLQDMKHYRYPKSMSFKKPRFYVHV